MKTDCLSCCCLLVVMMSVGCNPSETPFETLKKSQNSYSEPNEDLVCKRGVGGDYDEKLCRDMAEAINKTLAPSR